jgi:hypothetical protein
MCRFRARCTRTYKPPDLPLSRWLGLVLDGKAPLSKEGIPSRAATSPGHAEPH